MKNTILATIAVYLSLCIAPAWATIDSVVLGINGVACPVCSFMLKKKLQSLSFVSGVDIHLKKAIAEVKINPQEEFKLEEFNQMIKESGFSLRYTDLVLSGHIEGNRDQLSIVNGNQKLMLYETRKLQGKLHTARDNDQEIEVQGELFQKNNEIIGLKIKEIRG